MAVSGRHAKWDKTPGQGVESHSENGVNIRNCRYLVIFFFTFRPVLLFVHALRTVLRVLRGVCVFASGLMSTPLVIIMYTCTVCYSVNSRQYTNTKLILIILSMPKGGYFCLIVLLVV